MPDPQQPARDPLPAAAPEPLELVQRRTMRVLVIMQIIGTVGVGVAPSIGVLLAGEVTQNEAWAGLARTASTLGAALLGLPLGMVYLNERPGGMADAVVDGKQRIEAFRALVNNKVFLPASWFEDADYGDFVLATGDGPYIRWSDLTARGKGKIDRVRITVMRTRLETVEEEAALFELVNFGGVPQGESD